jgi:hypothetical protein
MNNTSFCQVALTLVSPVLNVKYTTIQTQFYLSDKIIDKHKTRDINGKMRNSDKREIEEAANESNNNGGSYLNFYP